jgi:hypothetical protein
MGTPTNAAEVIPLFVPEIHTRIGISIGNVAVTPSSNHVRALIGGPFAFPYGNCSRKVPLKPIIEVLLELSACPSDGFLNSITILYQPLTPHA